MTAILVFFSAEHGKDRCYTEKAGGGCSHSHPLSASVSMFSLDFALAKSFPIMGPREKEFMWASAVGGFCRLLLQLVERNLAGCQRGAGE